MEEDKRQHETAGNLKVVHINGKKCIYKAIRK